VLALFRDRHVLDRDPLVHGEMPDQKPDAVAEARLGGAQSTILECQRMLARPSTVVLGTVNRDKPRGHRSDHLAAIRPLPNHVCTQVHLAQHRRKATATARARDSTRGGTIRIDPAT